MNKKIFLDIANIISEKMGVNLVARGNGWSANNHSKTIYYPENIELNKSDMGFLLHESGHLRYSSPGSNSMEKIAVIAKNYNKDKDPFFELLNACEDVRIENKISEIYLGAKEYFDYNNDYYAEKMLDRLYKDRLLNPRGYDKFWKSRRWLQFTYAIHYYLGYGKEKVKELLDNYGDDSVIIAFELVEPHLPDLLKTTSTEDLLDHLSRNIFPVFKDLLDDVDNKPEQPQQQKSDDEEDSNSESYNFSEDKKKEDKKDNKKDKKKDKKKEEKKEAEKEEEKKEEKEEKKEKEPLEKDLQRGQRKEEEDSSFFQSNPNPSNRSVDDILGLRHSRVDDMKYEHLLDFVNKEISKAKKATSILKDMEYERWEPGHRSGRLDIRRIKKIFTGNDRVFQKKLSQQADNQDMAIAILVDESGSMDGSATSYNPYRNSISEDEDPYKDHKSRHAAKAVAVLAKALEITGKPYAIYGFNLDFSVHKKWNKKLDLMELLKIDHNTRREAADGNNDGYAIWKVVKELKKRPEKNKILIVFSDGHPAPNYTKPADGDGRNYDEYDLCLEAKKAEKEVKVYSFGIQSPAVQRFYKTFKIIENPEELAGEMIKLFKANVGKRRR